MGQVGEGALRAWICLSIGGQWRGWNEVGVVGAVEQEERAEVGLEACVRQPTHEGGAKRSEELYVVSKEQGDIVERLQAGMALTILVV